MANIAVGWFQTIFEVTLRRKDLEYSFQTPLQYHGLLRSPGTYTFSKKEKEEQKFRERENFTLNERGRGRKPSHYHVL